MESPEEDMKLEDLIPGVVEKVRENKNNKGILVCGSGVGVDIGANRFHGIRSCLADNSQIADGQLFMIIAMFSVFLVGAQTAENRLEKYLTHGLMRSMTEMKAD